MKTIIFIINLFFFSNTFFSQESFDSLKMMLNVGHSSSSIYAINSPDNRFIATYSKDIFSVTDFTIRLWDTKSAKLLKILEGHSDDINSLTFSPNGRLLLSASNDHTVRVWDLLSGRELKVIDSHTESVNSAVFSPDGNFILTASDDFTACIWDLSTFQLLRTLKCENEVLSGIFCSNGKTIRTVTGSMLDVKNCKVLIWDSENGSINRIFDGHFIAGKSEFSQDGKYITTSTEDNSIIWDIDSGKSVLSINGQFECFSPDSNHCISIKNEKVLIWNIKSGLITNKLIKHNHLIRSANYSQDGKFILTASDDKTARIWDAVTGKELHVLKGHSESLNSAVFVSDSNLVLSTANDYSARIWNVKTNECLNVLGGWKQTGINNMSKNGNLLSTFSDDAFAIWDINNRKSILKVDGSYINGEFSRDERFFISVDYSLNKVSCWDLMTKKQVFEVIVKDNLLGLELSENNRILLIKSEFLVRILDMNTWKIKYTFGNRKNRILEASLIPNTSYIYIVSIDNYRCSVFLYDYSKGQKVHRLSGHSSCVNSVEISSDGKKILTSSDDGTVRIWNFVNGKCIMVLMGHVGTVNKAIFSHNDEFVISTGEDNTTRFWDAETGNMTFLIEGQEFTANHLSLIKNGELLVTTYISDLFQSKSSINIWETNTGKEIKKWEDIIDLNQISIDEIHNKVFTLSTNGWKVDAYDMKLGNNIFTRLQIDPNNWLVKLPNSPYYMCSKDASKMLHYVTPSLKVIGFEQLDPVYNRPDIVLDSIGKYFGGADAELVANYRESWEKRIDRLGLDKEKLGKGEIAVPDAEIVDAEKIEYENKEGNLSISVKANDPKYPLRRFNVYVNEVPLYGSAGISIAHLNKQQWDTTISVPLSIGENKIQVSVMNELGLENFKYPTYVNYRSDNQIMASKTHYIGIGVNAFQQNEYNLTYCVKDVNDLAEAFGGENTVTKIFTDSEVTRSQILQLKQYLQDSTTVNDKVIISCSSHGLLDDSLNFYLATHDVDFDNPKEKGLKYEELESLLDGIPARQKLLLLDACNSGENDKTEMLKKELEQEKATMDSTSYLATRGVIIQLEEENKSNFKKMNELFVNVRNNTGSVIISAAGGQESALEGKAVEVNGKKIENGAFTYCLLEYLKANEDNTDALTVNQLKQYVENRVEEITNGKQKPTSRQETMEVDWRVR